MSLKKYIPIQTKRNIKAILNYGTKYHCPLCGSNLKQFYFLGVDTKVAKDLEITGSGWRAAGCYKCESSDRDRLVYLYMKNHTDIFEDNEKKVLHMAPERIIMEKILATKKGDYRLGDLFTEGYTYHERVENMDVTKLPLEDNYFDYVLCNHVLEHVPDDVKGMSEIFRVLKSGGNAILQVPMSNKLDKTFQDDSITDKQKREEAYGQFDHLRIYGKDYKERLESVGFKVEVKNFCSEDPKNIKYGINPLEDFFVITKP